MGITFLINGCPYLLKQIYNDNLIKVLEVQMRYIVSAYESQHDFHYEGGAPINSGFQIPLVNVKRKYGLSQQARTT
jgi:hypothetical protein